MIEAKVIIDDTTNAQLTAAIERVSSGGSGALVGAVASLIADSIRENILESRTPDGTPFEPLKRVREGKTPRPPGHGQDPRPLIDSGELLDSIGYQVESPVRALAGHTKDYGIIQSLPGEHRPGRPFVGVGPDAGQRINEVVAAFVVHALNGTGE